jgi:opacity protein-like surface antigen
MQALGGVTFGSETSQLFAGAAGFRWSKNVLITVEAGRVADMTSEATRENLTAVAANTRLMLAAVTGRNFEVVADAKTPAFYGMAGLRLTSPRTSRARPFVSGHTGFASVDPDVRLLVNGDDRTTSFLPPSAEPESRTRLLLGAGMGLTVRVTAQMSVDVGYRYSHVFVHDGVQLNRIYGALGVTF